jgi:hypothetical protein
MRPKDRLASQDRPLNPFEAIFWFAQFRSLLVEICAGAIVLRDTPFVHPLVASLLQPAIGVSYRYTVI